MVVTLIGYRGCGKSSVGPLLASMLGYECVDSDEVVQLRTGRNIADIFAQDGEAEFRRLESEVLKELFSRSKIVVAAGGGAILAEVNRERMREAGPVVWLQASATELASRIGGDSTSGSQRPSLTGRSIEDEVSEVLGARIPIYKAAATFEMNTENKTPEDIAENVFLLIAKSAEGASE